MWDKSHLAADTYGELRERFLWNVPRRFNIGTACADRQPPNGLAIIDVSEDRPARRCTFGDLTELSNRLANALASTGVRRGDRVGIVLPQRIETVVAHLAIYKLGAVALPLSRLFGPDALEFRLGHADARAVITEPRRVEAVVEATRGHDGIEIIVVDGERGPHTDLRSLLGAGSARFEAVETLADDPALLIYTSGTTGPPKGALHGHRVLIGHMPGFDLMYDRFGAPDDRMWTPADWAWVGGLIDALLPTLFHGRPTVAADLRGFDPEQAVDLMASHGVRNAFLPPTALKMLRRSDVSTSGVVLRSVMSGGEPLGQEMLAWGRDALGVTINEIYGQTEANLVVGNSQSLWEVRPGSMGLPFPGHDVAIIDADGSPVSPGRVGEIAVRAPNPVMFLRYWNRPEATEEKFRNGWMLTGDLGEQDEAGYLWFRARTDDVITSAGYRIGPGEIEDCLMGHAAVAAAGVIGVPDDTRGHVVKAYVQLVAGTTPAPGLADELRDHVRARLAAHEYPREIEFIDELPMTTTGKIRRADLRDRHQTQSGLTMPVAPTSATRSSGEAPDRT